jgi:hypothetical protein
MNTRLKTDFLCESSSFLAGMGSILNLRGQAHHYNSSDDPDDVAIAHDWHMIGQDIRDALKNAEAESRNPLARK